MDFKHHPSTDFRPLEALSRDQAADEIEALREGIRHHDYLYYVKTEPAISDAVYDQLFDRLQALEAEFPSLQSENSPTQRIGAEPVSALNKREHRAAMLSLESVQNDDEVADFIKRLQRDAGGGDNDGDGDDAGGGDDAGDGNQGPVALVLEPKFDGLSIELIYDQGVFSSGSTRGDGYTGEDISHNLRRAAAVPMRLHKAPRHLAVRAEIFMPRSGFTALNRERVQRGDEPFANPRNAAAGLMRQLDPNRVAGRPLDLFCYELLEIDGEAAPATHHQLLERLADWGLKTCPLNRNAEHLDDVRAYHAELEGQRDTLDVEIDGVVIKLDDRARRETLGVRARSPRWALAWKFAPREEITTLEEITVQVGRTGILTPIALLQPVDVGGVTVSRATLHNADEVQRKDVRPGDQVRIIRAGDVIPEIAERIEQPGQTRAPSFAMPEHCPVCSTEIIRDGAYHRCPAGLACEAQLVGQITHYASRDALDIDGLGEETARQLVERGLVHDLADLYRLETQDLEAMEGFGETAARNLVQAIDRARRPSLQRFVYALGIRHIGARMATVLTRRFGSLDALLKADRTALERIPEVGPEIAAAVVAFFDNADNRQVLEKLRDAGVEVEDVSEQEPAQADDSHRLSGKTFVFTGELAHYSRREAQSAVEARGGRATSDVSSATDYLVRGKDPGSKAERAQDLGIEILDEAEFEQLLEQG
ncbi:MAG: NAD-dependent DNA ligase LigA [Chromatiaceae bacterium]|nr:NAD-dependent DNA ligase LigA [Chromatiaceae bacterium]